MLKHEKFEEIFGAYKEAIGITAEQNFPEWVEFNKRYETQLETYNFKANQEKKKREEAEKMRRE